MPEGYPGQLLEQARKLAQFDTRGRPQQVNLRRAASSAYYGIFHFLIEEATRFLIGNATDQLRLRASLSRAFDHSEMKDACIAFSQPRPHDKMRKCFGSTMVVAREVQNLAAAFVEAQRLRQIADYDLTARFQRSEILLLVDRVTQAIDDAAHVRQDVSHRTFLVSCLTWRRLGRG